MIGALFFLLWHSWKNRLLLRIRRLKQPKYLIGLIVGGLYLFSIFGQRFFFGPGRRGAAAQVSMINADNVGWIEGIAACILMIFVVGGWIFPSDRAALTFSEAEIAFLFPAPVNRRSLIHYQLLKGQVRIILLVLFLTLITGRFTAGSVAWIHALGWWVILSTYGLHQLGASFTRTWLLDRGVSNWKRRAIVLLLVGAVGAGVVIWAKNTLPSLELSPAPDPAFAKDFAEGRRLMLEDYLKRFVQSGPMPYLLYPFRLVVQPYMSLDWSDFFLALGPALLLMALHYVWVLSANVAFEEASIDRSRKIAERLSAIRESGGAAVATPTKKKKPPFRLGTSGPPAVALLWKNLIGAGQTFALRVFLLIFSVVMIFCVVMSRSAGGFNVTNVVGIVALWMLGMSFFAGPQWVRQDFRQDLRMMDVLKTYPLKGWQMAAGELAAPALILTAAQWILIVVAAFATAKLGREEVPLEWRLAGGGSLAMLAPALNAVVLIIPNAAVLMFPAWFGTGKENTQGIEVMGQRMIFALGQFVVLLAALVPAGLAGLATFLLARIALPPVAAVPIGASWAMAVLAAEAWLGLLWLGRLFEKFDLSEEQGS